MGTNDYKEQNCVTVNEITNSGHEERVASVGGAYKKLLLEFVETLDDDICRRLYFLTLGMLGRS